MKIEGIEKLQDGKVLSINEFESFIVVRIATSESIFALDIEAGKVRVLEIDSEARPVKESDRPMKLWEALEEQIKVLQKCQERQLNKNLEANVACQLADTISRLALNAWSIKKSGG